MIARFHRHLPPHPVRQGDRLVLSEDLDLSEDQTAQDALVHVHLPGQPGMGDKVTGLLDDVVQREGLQHRLSVGEWDLILELQTREPLPGALESDRGSRPLDAHAQLAAIGPQHQTIAESMRLDHLSFPAVVADEEFAFDLVSHPG